MEDFKRRINAVINLFYSLISLFYFLLQNGDIIIPGTTETDNYVQKYTESFTNVLQISGIIIGVLGIGVLVYNFIMQKRYSGITKVGMIIALCVCAFTSVCIFIVGSIPITCILGILASVLIFIPNKR